MRRASLALCGSALATTLFAGMPVPASSGGSRDNPCYRFSASQQRLARRTNAARVGAGIRALSLDPELSRVASKHTRIMAKKGRLFHTPDHLLAWRVTNWYTLAENVGVGKGIRDVHGAYMSSPEHAANVLFSGFVHLGVGVRRARGDVWTTVLLQSEKNPGTRIWMPDC